MYLFELEFSPGVCPGVGLLDHTVTLIFSFLRSLHTFPLMAAPTYFHLGSFKKFRSLWLIHVDIWQKST